MSGRACFLQRSVHRLLSGDSSVQRQLQRSSRYSLSGQYKTMSYEVYAINNTANQDSQYHNSRTTQ